MAENTTEKTTREQKAFTWKAGYKEAVEPKFEAWAEAQPEGKKAFQDYILFLQTKADSAGSQGELDTRIEKLGIAPLVEMHKRRTEADARMLEQIADLLEDAKGKAQAEVKDLLTALQKTADQATATASGLMEEKKKIETRLAETAAALEKKEADAATLAERLEAAESEKTAALIRLEKAEADAAALAAEKQEQIEKTAAALGEAQARIAAQQEQAERQITAMTAAQEKIASLTAALTAAEKKIATHENKIADMQTLKERIKTLETAAAETAAAQKATEAALTTAKIESAAAEAKAAAQESTIAALQKALESATRPEEKK